MRNFSLGKLLPYLIFALVGYALLSVTLTYAAVVRVETQYQFRRLASHLETTSLKSIFIPNLRSFNLSVQGSTRDFGIVIPGIFINEPVVFNVDPTDKKAYTQALKQGIAHAAGTGLPGSGNLGYYFAHSSNPELRSQYNAIFYLLGKLQEGDTVEIWYDGRPFSYRVYRTEVTESDDVSFLSGNYSKETVVLQTCWPPGTTHKRLLVFTELE